MRNIPVPLRHLGSRSAAAVTLAAALTSLVVGAGTGVAAGQVGPPDGTPRAGTATFTDLTGPGACSFLGEPPDNLHVGLSSFEYGTATDCGGYLDVVGPAGTVRVKVTDHCRNCEPGLIDVTRTAFARIADVAAGRVPVTYRLVRDPPLAEAISLRVKTGSSRWWLQIQALDHGNPLARFEARQDGGWRRLVHTADNYWAAEDPGLGDGPFTVRLTDVFGQQVTIDGVELAPGVVQATGARLYPAPGETGPPAPPTTHPPTRRGPATTVDALNPGGLPPPLSILPSSPAAGDDDETPGDETPDDETPGDEVAAGAGTERNDDGGGRPGDGNGGGTIGPLVLLLAVIAAFARTLTWWRARHAHPTDQPGAAAPPGQALRPTAQ